MARENVSVPVWALEPLSKLGLYVNEEPGDPLNGTESYEAAICRVGATLVQSVALALAASESETALDSGYVGSWPEGDEYSPDEARIALGGIAAILRYLPRLAEELRDARLRDAELAAVQAARPPAENESEERLRATGVPVAEPKEVES